MRSIDEKKMVIVQGPTIILNNNKEESVFECTIVVTEVLELPPQKMIDFAYFDTDSAYV